MKQIFAHFLLMHCMLECVQIKASKYAQKIYNLLRNLRLWLYKLLKIRLIILFPLFFSFIKRVLLCHFVSGSYSIHVS